MFRRKKRGRGRESAYEVLMHPVMNIIYKIDLFANHGAVIL